MRVYLARDLPPPDATEIDIGTVDGRRLSLTTTPRQILVDGTPRADLRPELLQAIERCCVVLFGHPWAAPLETVADLRRGAVREWRRDENIPPPKIVAWLAYLSGLEDCRAIARFLQGLAEGGDQASMAEAAKAFRGLRGKA